MSDFHLKINFKDAPPEVQAWYLEQLQKHEAAEVERVRQESESKGEWSQHGDPFSPEGLTLADGTIYRRDPSMQPVDAKYRAHVSEALKRMAGEQ